MPVIQCKFTTPSGEFAVPHVIEYQTGVDRHPTTTGEVGSYGHDLRDIRILRLKSLRGRSGPKVEEETVQLAAEVGDQAYFGGELTLAPANAPNQIVQRLAWDEGHITGISWELKGEDIHETIHVCVRKLKVDNSEFRRNQDTEE